MITFKGFVGFNRRMSDQVIYGEVWGDFFWHAKRRR